MQHRILVYLEDIQYQDFFDLFLGSNNLYEITISDEVEDFKDKIKKQRPEVLLLIFNNNNYNNNLITWISKHAPHSKTLVLLEEVKPEMIFESLKSGASGIIEMEEGPYVLLDAVESILEDGAPLGKTVSKHIVKYFNWYIDNNLSLREYEVLQLLSKGMTNPQIAKILELSVDTIKSHLRRIYGKLGVNSKNEALNILSNEKLI